ncbi:MAG: sigma-54-dependent Fis family transcriptional regulator, partial [Deltaproteobacteria bacterium]|nr:sigma-54-dependent Fis family transcriptional regulator [Deltaproteobacteria bacterium]
TPGYIVRQTVLKPKYIVKAKKALKQAFTGAWKDKPGLVQEAHGGTLFLDEIGDMGTHMQTKLLRLLQEGEYKPVGSVVTQKADLRFIAATNHNMDEAIKDKRFREDLYYRLNVIRFDLPRLADRKQDIPLLSYHFLKKYARRNQKDIREISTAAIHALASQDFRGNVRELENTIERGVIFCKTDALEVKDLFLDNPQTPFYPALDQAVSHLSFKDAKDKMIELFYEQYIHAILLESNGNISKAAESAGIQRQYLHRLMKEAGIDAEGFKQKNQDLV